MKKLVALFEPFGALVKKKKLTLAGIAFAGLRKFDGSYLAA